MHILNSMNVEKLLNVVVKAGKMLIESGAEIYRVEETMIRLCQSYPDVQIADSFVTGTGIMLSITVDGKTSTRIGRVRSKSVDLNLIDMINSLSRRVSQDPISVDELEKEIDILLQKERDSLELLETIPGISKISASSIIAEIGTSMDVFKTEKHISSWAAWSATKKKDSRFKNKYWSMVPRMGRKKALIAIANMMLRLIYHLLKTKSTYKELEIQYFIDKDKRREDRIIKELKSKGYLVEKDSL